MMSCALPPDSGARARQQRLIEAFALIDDWAGRYDYLIELGRQLPPVPAHLRTDRFRVPGCRGSVTLAAEYRDDAIDLYGESNMPVVAGLLAVIVDLYSGLSRGEILRQPMTAIECIGLTEHLSPHRRITLLRIHEHLTGLAATHEPQRRWLA